MAAILSRPQNIKYKGSNPEEGGSNTSASLTKCWWYNHSKTKHNKTMSISMVRCKTGVTPVHWQWSYWNLALSHRYIMEYSYKEMGPVLFFVTVTFACHYWWCMASVAAYKIGRIHSTTIWKLFDVISAVGQSEWQISSWVNSIQFQY